MTMTASPSSSRLKSHVQSAFTAQPEPHRSRRLAILSAHPEIKALFRPTSGTFPAVAVLVAIQLAAVAFLSSREWGPENWKFWLVAYIVGGTANQALFLAIHELTHNLGSPLRISNKAFSLLANLPVAVPYAGMFKVYHLEHHRYLGEDQVDTDIPTTLEVRLLDSTLGKLFFVTFQIFFYALRPGVVRPLPPSMYIALNWAVQLAFNFAMVRIFGWDAITYLLASSFFAGSLHPCAAHFIAEHYILTPQKQEMETCSYYGPLNKLTFNVGYHVEHHDFPNISWTLLPKVREIAPEFYEDLYEHKSWCGVMWTFVTSSQTGLWARVRREQGLKSAPGQSVAVVDSSKASSLAKEADRLTRRSGTSVKNSQHNHLSALTQTTLQVEA